MGEYRVELRSTLALRGEARGCMAFGRLAHDHRALYAGWLFACRAVLCAEKNALRRGSGRCVQKRRK